MPPAGTVSSDSQTTADQSAADRSTTGRTTSGPTTTARTTSPSPSATVTPAGATPPGAVTDPQEIARISAGILDLLLPHRRASDPGVHVTPADFPIQLEQLADFLSSGDPILFTLPGFPCKSPNLAKVLSHLPDEESASRSPSSTVSARRSASSTSPARRS